MSDLFKKIVSPFVEFKESERPEQPAEAPEGEAAAAGEVAPSAVITSEELAADPDVARVQQAIQLLGTLPLSDIPVDKARGLIVATLRFAGMEVEQLLASFQRVEGLYQASMESERQAILQRTQRHEETVEKLKTALRMEEEQFSAELTERNKRIETANTDLGKIEQARAFFKTEG